ncbi:hypothetical protein BH10BAC1_BH10BAC1_11580 [soil metagenome]
MFYMKKNKREVAFKNVCDYCNKEFTTSMPFARFCSDNHRKYFAYRKNIYEKTIHKQSINESDELIEELLKMGASNETTLEDLIEKSTKAAKKIKAYKKIKDNIDYYVKEFIQKANSKSKKNSK